MKKLAIAALVVGLAGLTGGTRAEDKKADPTGTWKWTVEFKDQKREQTLKLKLDGDKLTGTIATGGGKGAAKDTKIEDGKFKDGEVSFTVTREFNDMKFTSTYKGKVDGDTMKGTMEAKFGEKDVKQEFEGKREKSKD